MVGRFFFAAVIAMASLGVLGREAGAQEAEAQEAGVPAEMYDPTGAANSAAKLAKAAKIIELAMPRSRFAEMLARLEPMLAQTIREEAARAGVTGDAEAAQRAAAIVSEELAGLPNELRPGVIQIYAGALTEPELDALIALYSSPEGRSVLQKLPGVSDRIAQSMRGGIAAFHDRVQTRIAEELSGEAN